MRRTDAGEQAGLEAVRDRHAMALDSVNRQISLDEVSKATSRARSSFAGLTLGLIGSLLLG